MLIYYFIIILILFFIIISCATPRLNTALLFVSSLIIYLIISFKGLSVSRDAYVYYNVYDVLKSIPFTSVFQYSSQAGQEFGFLILMKVCSTLNLNFFQFKFIYEFLCLASLLYIILKYVPKQFQMLSLCIYVAMFMLFRDFTQIRFCLSCLLAIISLLKTLEHKFKKSYLIIITAILFHNAALIMIPILLAYRLFKNNLFKLSFAIILLIISIVIALIDPIKFIESLSFMPHQFTRYIGTDGMKGQTLGINFIISFGLTIFLAWSYKKNKKINGTIQYKLVYITMLSSTCIAIAFFGIPILMRMQILCLTGIILMPPVLYNGWVKKTAINNYIFQLVIASIFVFEFYKVLNSNIVFPYVTFLGS